MADEITFRYFRSVEGMVVPRYGTSVVIGATRDQKIGWIWDTAAVVRIPEAEVLRYWREYTRALKDGALVECTRADYDALEAGTAAAPEAPARTAPKRRKGEEE